MENTEVPSMEDDIFTPRDAPNSKPSSSRIHFPPHEPSSTRPVRYRPDVPKGFSTLAPPVRRGSPLNPQNASDPRRRGWPSDLPPASPESSLLRHKRNPSIAGLTRMEPPPTAPDSEMGVGVFSDEYDLYPRILQDVQRALKLKARREARLKKDLVVTPEKRTSHHTSPSSDRKELGEPILQPHFSSSPSISLPSSRKLSSSTSSDVDFSPSTGIFDHLIQAHPIPSSLDNGTTLDWTGTISDDGINRKEKDRLPPLRVLADEQEQIHKVKLSRTRNMASSQTTRKANITSDQLERRYNLIYNAIETDQAPVNLAEIVRWYGAQDQEVRNSLEKAEPFTWLKHLDKRVGKANRSPRHLSALIMEECYHARHDQGRMQTIPEGSTTLDSTTSYPRKPDLPSFPSRGASHAQSSSFSTTLPTDDRISFEPFAESRGHSLDIVSRKGGKSAPNSIRSGSSNAGVLPLSPASSRVNHSYKDPRSRITTNRTGSPGSCSSDTSDDSYSRLPEPINSLTVPEVSLQPPSSEALVGSNLDPIPVSVNPSTGSSGSSQKKSLFSHAGQSMTSLKGSLRLRKARMSPDSGERITRRDRRHREVREEQLRLEYESKANLLHDTIAHNHRIRQFLNRISAAMKEYDALQISSFGSRGINQPPIPKELLEAFVHDPSAITGATRRARGWRVVEDIHERVHRQRHTFRAFIDSFAEDTSNQGCRLDDSIDGILQALEELELHRAEIVLGAEAVANLLESVQENHGNVKDNYNSTVSHTSVVYPELTHIVALEESYKDQYQQFWELGMDALTLLLDTVTPVWRTYGKTIGEDVRDFLIIPLYRNEFTGEAKQYRIRGFPSRSLRHWVGLVLFFVTSIGVNILQLRAAITSTLNCRLLLIPYDGVRWTALPFFWIAIIIQWLAVIFEFVIVFLQLAVITWWTGWVINLAT
ncbi:hypothetical protein M413DRAFT_439448 [Hebeloma cylindrosporum]|uniref:Uncharacterized protein n=1 Tax=Hebeloma cylindrosporum TaxID=76867 RepID=A0A0C2YD98_HEBCY|nr:hypothetical protein M413DRAFT_439448 [Hebeloma cylindrosporum h7]